MATLDDRILGEKLHNYCSSSSESETEDDDQKHDKNATLPPPNSEEASSGTCNTGPKGVLKDWQRYKQLETENRKEQEREKLNLAKKLAMSCLSHNDEEKAKEKQDEEDEESQIEAAILQQYIAKRLEEMHSSVNIKKSFGCVIHLNNGDDFLECIDTEIKSVTIIIHIYEDCIPSCQAMNGCLTVLAQERRDVKFCRIKSSSAKVSKKFKLSGLPALLVYKEGQIIGNFVRLEDEFGDDFYASDVESFLIEHGMIGDNFLVSDRKIRSSDVRGNRSDSSDDD